MRLAQKQWLLLILSIVNILEGTGLFEENVFCMPETDIYLARKMSRKRDQLGAHFLMAGVPNLEDAGDKI